MAGPQTSAPARSDNSQTNKEHPKFFLALAIAVSAIWFTFISYAALGAAQYLGSRAVPTLIAKLPNVVSWAGHQPLVIQVALGVGLVILAVLTVWATWRAYLLKQRSAVAKRRERAKELETVVSNVSAPRAPVLPAHQLSRDSFQLGDSEAANFPYITGPVEDIYNAAVRALRAASQGVGKGILVLGNRNSGKTRLAFEALTQTLPNWLVLQWGSGYAVADRPNPEGQVLSGQNYVVFVDDLQDFAIAAMSARVSAHCWRAHGANDRDGCSWWQPVARRNRPAPKECSVGSSRN